MSEITRILSALGNGDQSAAGQLLLLIYDELRSLAAANLANERPDHTLQPTALVHEVYLRLVDVNEAQQWDNKGHFFAAAAEAMRRILVENARRKKTRKRGGGWAKIDLSDAGLESDQDSDDLLALDEALDHLAKEKPRKAEVVKLKFFAGMTLEEIASAQGVSLRTVNNDWKYAKSWLYVMLSDNSGSPPIQE